MRSTPKAQHDRPAARNCCVEGRGIDCLQADPLTARRSLLGPVSGLVAGSTIDGVTDDDEDRPEPPSAKVVTALLREARSLSRRADKLSGTAAAVDDPTTQQLAAEACTSIEQLVHHLMVLERHLQRGEKSAGRRQ
jgi:hypothetical protein